MPYNRRYNPARGRGRRNRRRRGGRRNRRRPNNASATYSAYYNTRMLRRLMNVEKKWKDTQLGQALNNIQIVTITDIPSGTGTSSRVGNTVKLQSINVNIVWYYNDGGSDADKDATQIFRFILFKWRNDTNNNAPVADDILDNAAGPINSFYNKYSGRSFKILRDFRIVMSKSQHRKKSAKISLPQQANLEFDTNGNQKTGHYYIMTIGNGVATDTTSDSVSWTARVTYTDA